MSTTPSPSTTPRTPTTYDARRLVSAALTQYADSWSAKLTDELADPAVVPDIALARALAENVTGWTHTTRLREFLEANTALVDDLARAIGDDA